MDSQNEELMQFFKAFVDVGRLKIVGVLAKDQASIQTLADHAGMSASEVLRHVEQLRETGLVSSHLMENGQEMFGLEPRILEDMAKRQFIRVREMVQPVADQRKIPANFTEEETKILMNFTHPNGEIKQIPLQQKKQMILIRYARHHVLQALEPGKQYTEKEINLLIKQLHPDAAFFRRNFVDTGYLDRHANGSAYWLSEKGAAAAAGAGAGADAEVAHD